MCAYKTGPDYIDPQYLRQAGHCEAYNLDTWLMTPERTRELFAKTARGHDIAIIEGAMGLYDGGQESTAGISRLLGVPVILVVDAASVGESAVAVALGFREYDHDVNIAGVILNRVGSDYHAEIIADALASRGIKLLGVFRRNRGLAVPERHLGLVPVPENAGYDPEELGRVAGECVNIPEVLKCAREVPDVPVQPITQCVDGVRVGIARDEAFSFYYPESLSVLEDLGAELVYFSPVHDDALPVADGYIFGGGFPEMFAEELSANASMLASVRNNLRPVLAECGGYMYLCRSIDDHAMAGVLPYDAIMTSRPVVGYMEARALRDNLLCESGEIIRGHEFHYSQIDVGDNAFTGKNFFVADLCKYLHNLPLFEMKRKRTGKIHYGGCVQGNITASYLHVNFFGNIDCAKRFLSHIDIKQGLTG